MDKAIFAIGYDNNALLWASISARYAFEGIHTDPWNTVAEETGIYVWEGTVLGRDFLGSIRKAKAEDLRVLLDDPETYQGWKIERCGNVTRLVKDSTEIEYTSDTGFMKVSFQHVRGWVNLHLPFLDEPLRVAEAVRIYESETWS